MKKLITFALALIMTLALSVPAFAEDTTIKQDSESNQGKTTVTYEVGESYTVVIPESVTLGDEFTVKCTEYNLEPDYGVYAAIKGLNDNAKVVLSRKDDTDYKITADLSINLGATADWQKLTSDDSLVFTLAADIPGIAPIEGFDNSYTFKVENAASPDSNPIKAGSYSGTVTFEIGYAKIS